MTKRDRIAKLTVGLTVSFLVLGSLSYGVLSTEYPKYGGKVVKVKKVKLENNFLDNPNILGVVMR